jgi:hypothetical protein
MTKKGRGGARPGAGRKAAKVKKEPIFIYIPSTEIKAVGGREAVKTFAEAAISRQAKKCG